jgi:transcriptional regulator with XRE-family HTH domain
MNPTRGTAAHVAQNSGGITERLRAFMQTHGLGLEELAALLHTSPQTLEHWFQEGMTPPACLLALALVLGTSPSRRDAPREKVLPHGSAFSPANGHPSNESEQEKALRMVRAI